MSSRFDYPLGGSFRCGPVLVSRCLLVCQLGLLFAALSAVQAFHDSVQDWVARALGGQPLRRAAGLAVLLSEALAGRLSGGSPAASLKGPAAAEGGMRVLLVQIASQLAGPAAVWLLACTLLALQLRTTGLPRTAFSAGPRKARPHGFSEASELDGGIQSRASVEPAEESTRTGSGQGKDQFASVLATEKRGPEARLDRSMDQTLREGRILLRDIGDKPSSPSSQDLGEVLDETPTSEVCNAGGTSARGPALRPPFYTRSSARAVRAAGRLLVHVLMRMRPGDVLLPFRPLRFAHLLLGAPLAASAGQLAWVAVSGSVVCAALGLLPLYPGADGGRLLCTVLGSPPAHWAGLAVACSRVERAQRWGAGAAVTLLTLWDAAQLGAEAWSWPGWESHKRGRACEPAVDFPEPGSSGESEVSAGRWPAPWPCGCGAAMVLRSACHTKGSAACRYDGGARRREDVNSASTYFLRKAGPGAECWEQQPGL